MGAAKFKPERRAVTLATEAGARGDIHFGCMAAGEHQDKNHDEGKYADGRGFAVAD